MKEFKSEKKVIDFESSTIFLLKVILVNYHFIAISMHYIITSNPLSNLI